MNRNEIPLSPHVTFLTESSCLVNGAKEEIHLTPNERRLLKLIIAEKGRKELIIDEVWHSRGVVVGESSYHQLIKMLRKKLQLAGLPASMIKTIPRHGIRLVPYEPAPLSLEEGEEGLDSLSSSTDDPLSLNIDTTNSYQDITSCPPDKEPGSSVDTGELLKVAEFGLKRKQVMILTLFFFILILIIYYGLLWAKPTPFPYQLKNNQVIFHFSSLRNEDRQAYLQYLGKLKKETRHVYIASNGPKVWVAACESEIAKEAKCHYENYSVY